MRTLSSVILAASATVAHAAEPTLDRSLDPQIQLDLGLSVIGIGYEQPIGGRIAVTPEAFVFGTYFLPWFDRGDRMVGGGGGLRVTWFRRDDGRGLYVTPYVRGAFGRLQADLAAGQDDAATAVTGGLFVGYAFALSRRIDLRLGGGVQYIWIDATDTADTSTPFVALDAVIGYRF